MAYKICILLRFFNIRTSNTNTLSMPLHPLGVAPGVVVHGESEGDPVPPGLEGLHAEELPHQLVLQLGGLVRTVGGCSFSVN